MDAKSGMQQKASAALAARAQGSAKRSAPFCLLNEGVWADTERREKAAKDRGWNSPYTSLKCRMQILSPPPPPGRADARLPRIVGRRLFFGHRGWRRRFEARGVHEPPALQYRFSTYTRNRHSTTKGGDLGGFVAGYREIHPPAPPLQRVGMNPA